MKLNSGTKKLIVIFNDIIISIISTYLALIIRYESIASISNNHLYAFIIFSILFLPFFFYFDLYSNIIRYTDIGYYKSLLYCFIFYIISSIIIFIFFTVPFTPRSISVLQPFIFLFGILISRIFAVRILKNIFNINKEISNIIIFGAGESGAKLLSLINNTYYNVVGFIDEDENKIGRKINGKKIYKKSDISNLKKDKKVNLVLFAISNLNIFKKNQ